MYPVFRHTRIRGSCLVVPFPYLDLIQSIIPVYDINVQFFRLVMLMNKSPCSMVKHTSNHLQYMLKNRHLVHFSSTKSGKLRVRHVGHLHGLRPGVVQKNLSGAPCLSCFTGVWVCIHIHIYMVRSNMYI